MPDLCRGTRDARRGPGSKSWMECRTLWAGVSATAILRLYPDEVETKNGSQSGSVHQHVCTYTKLPPAIDSLRTRRFKHGHLNESGYLLAIVANQWGAITGNGCAAYAREPASVAPGCLTALTSAASTSFWPPFCNRPSLFASRRPMTSGTEPRGVRAPRNGSGSFLGVCSTIQCKRLHVKCLCGQQSALCDAGHADFGIRLGYVAQYL